MENIIINKTLENQPCYEESYPDDQKPCWFTDDGFLHICDGKERHCYWIGEAELKKHTNQVLKEYKKLTGLSPEAL